MPIAISVTSSTSPKNTTMIDATAPAVHANTIANMTSAASNKIVNIIKYLLPFIISVVNIAEKEKTQRRPGLILHLNIFFMSINNSTTAAIPIISIENIRVMSPAPAPNKSTAATITTGINNMNPNIVNKKFTLSHSFHNKACEFRGQKKRSPC